MPPRDGGVLRPSLIVLPGPTHYCMMLLVRVERRKLRRRRVVAIIDGSTTDRQPVASSTPCAPSRHATSP
eukprot:COSAG05_NODE_258_length_12741_cov_168.778279_16_plen_70_part_00